MNYAWAIALIIIVGVAIYALDIGGLRTSIGGQGSQLSGAADTLSMSGPPSFKANNGPTANATLQVAFQNNGPNKLNFTNATITEFDGSTLSAHVVPCSPNKIMYSGDRSLASDCTIQLNQSSAGITKSAGQSFSLKLKITYNDTATGILYTPTYTISGKAQ